VSYGASVEAAIDQIGEPLTLRKEVGGTFNKNTGGFTVNPSNEDHSFTGRVSRFRTMLINGTTVLDGDIEVIAVGFEGNVEPVPGDQMIRDGDGRAFSIISADPEVIGSDVVFYRLHIRGA
jgi:hypothetical protein